MNREFMHSLDVKCEAVDVLVVGAGPAGTTAAKVLAGKGFRVLLAERCKLPRYKSCSGVLIQKTMTLICQIFGKTPPALVTCSPAENRGMVFTDDRGKSYRFEQPGLNVWRDRFDFWLASEASRCGAEILDGTEVTDCKETDGGVLAALQGKKTGLVQAKFLVDCEGVTGVLKRKLTGGARDFITTFQTFNRGTVALDSHYFYAYLQPEFSEYDAWFNVKDDLLVLGVSVKDRGKISGFYQKFTAYLAEHHQLCIQEQLRQESWLMPRILPGCPVFTGSDRILFAGETAGFLNPMGEGISAAIESGYHAAYAIASAWETPEKAKERYRERIQPLAAYMRRHWDFTARLAAPFKNMKKAENESDSL